MPLTNPVDSRDGLQLDGRVDQGLAEEDVARVDEVEAAGVCSGVQEEDLDGGVFFKASDASAAIDSGEANAEALESSG
jgi:hypothetical protein